MTDIFEVKNVHKELGVGAARQIILNDVSFSARQGEFLSVVGPSGCGKTTLLMCLAGLYGVDAGSITFEGQAISGPSPGVSVVFQDYSRSLLPWKKNIDNVMFGMKRVSLNNAAKRESAMELLLAVGLKGFETHYPWQVSGGMQQRVAIARGLAAQSRLLLLDEPLAAVDAQTRAEMQDLLLQLAQRFNQTCLLVTHDIDEAVYMADRIVVLSRRPTRTIANVEVPLSRPRDQLTTREDAAYLSLRHQVITMIRSTRKVP